MTYEVIILGHLHMPLYFIGTFTEYSYLHRKVWIVALAMRKVSPETCLLVKQTVHTKFLCL